MSAAGRGTKSPECFGQLLTVMLEHGFTRGDAVLALGGGVVGGPCGLCRGQLYAGRYVHQLPHHDAFADRFLHRRENGHQPGGHQNTVGRFLPAQPCGGGPGHVEKPA